MHPLPRWHTVTLVWVVGHTPPREPVGTHGCQVGPILRAENGGHHDALGTKHNYSRFWPSITLVFAFDEAAEGPSFGQGMLSLPS